MIEKIRSTQEDKVKELFNLSFSHENNNSKNFYLKAPTGSGKTYMQGYLMSLLINKYPDCKIIYHSLSKGLLAKQGYDAINNYNFNNIKSYLLNSEISAQERLAIPNNYNVYFLPRDLNKKANSILKNPLKDFLTYQTKNVKKFLIVDECHESHKNIDLFEN